MLIEPLKENKRYKIPGTVILHIELTNNKLLHNIQDGGLAFARSNNDLGISVHDGPARLVLKHDFLSEILRPEIVKTREPISPDPGLPVTQCCIGQLADLGEVGKVFVVFREECGDMLENLQKISDITYHRILGRGIALASRSRGNIPPLGDC